MRWWMLLLACLVLQISLQADTQQGRSRTTKRPAKRKATPPPSFFSLISTLVRETVADANLAAANISQIISETFPSQNAANKVGSSTTGNATDRVTYEFAANIINRNYRALMRLFRVEFSNAIRDSRKNIERYRKEFRNSIRPYFLPNEKPSNTTKTKA